MYSHVLFSTCSALSSGSYGNCLLLKNFIHRPAHAMFFSDHAAINLTMFSIPYYHSNRSFFNHEITILKRVEGLASATSTIVNTAAANEGHPDPAAHSRAAHHEWFSRAGWHFAKPNLDFKASCDQSAISATFVSSLIHRGTLPHYMFVCEMAGSRSNPWRCFRMVAFAGASRKNPSFCLRK